MTVLYAQVPCFYAAVERAAGTAPADRPVIVGGDPRKNGRVSSASPDALAAGVEIEMPVLVALERCPHARAVRTDMPRYREASRRLHALLRRELPRMEPAGLDAAYLEPGPGDDPEKLAGSLSDQVRAELSLPLRVGIARVRFLARLAAEEGGGPGIYGVAPGREGEFLRPLPIALLPGVGPRTSARLAELGVRRVGELIALGPESLEAELGNRGLELLALARGEGETSVRAVRQRQSLSQESTFERAQRDLGSLSERLHEIAARLEEGLAVDGLAARRVTLKVRYADLETTSRRVTLRAPITSAAAIHSAALSLLRRTQAGTREVRLLGIALASLGPVVRDDRQLELFPAPG